MKEIYQTGRSLTAALLLVGLMLSAMSVLSTVPVHGETMSLVSIESNSAYIWITVDGSTVSVKYEGYYIHSEDSDAGVSAEHLSCAFDDNSETVATAIQQKVEAILKRGDPKVTGVSDFTMELEKGETKIQFRLEFKVNGVVNGREVSMVWLGNFKATDADKVRIQNIGGASHDHSFHLYNTLMMDWGDFTDLRDFETSTSGDDLILQEPGDLDPKGWGSMSEWEQDVKITVKSGVGSTINESTIDLPGPAVTTTPTDYVALFRANQNYAIAVFVIAVLYLFRKPIKKMVK